MMLNLCTGISCRITKLTVAIYQLESWKCIISLLHSSNTESFNTETRELSYTINPTEQNISISISIPEAASAHRVTLKRTVVGESHWVDEFFDIMPVDWSRISPGGGVSTNWKQSFGSGGTVPTVNSSPESERRTTKTRVALEVSRRVLLKQERDKHPRVLVSTDPTGRQMLLMTETMRQNAKPHNFWDIVLMTPADEFPVLK